jgi:hypothetical protein
MNQPWVRMWMWSVWWSIWWSPLDSHSFHHRLWDSIGIDCQRRRRFAEPRWLVGVIECWVWTCFSAFITDFVWLGWTSQLVLSSMSYSVVDRHVGHIAFKHVLRSQSCAWFERFLKDRPRVRTMANKRKDTGWGGVHWALDPLNSGFYTIDSRLTHSLDQNQLGN